MTRTLSAITVAGVALLTSTVRGQHPPIPTDMTHDQHLTQTHKEAQLKARGAVAMGFDQDAVTHHFLLKPSGGSIDVEVRDPLDTRNLEAIRRHLREIARQFAVGDFKAPFTTHGEVPPGVPAMQRLKSTITYSYRQTSTGGRVEIVTQNPETLAAVHEFLRFQITEHHTSDPLTSN
jgi:hypothetical protein